VRTSRKQNRFITGIVRQILVITLIIAPLTVAAAQQQKRAAAKDSVTGTYQGTAKNNAQDIIQLTLELTEKDGAMSGMIRSDHGDFTITGGSHKGEDVTLEFNAGGPTGAINLKFADDKLSGTWSAGDDGGPVDVKKVAGQEQTKEKS